MSASNKKKLRKEQATAALTQRQQQEKADAKKLKTYTIVFAVIMALVIVIAVAALVDRYVTTSGIKEKSTIAATIGDKDLNTVQFSYYFNDSVNEEYSEMYQTYGQYASMIMGLDQNKPLDDQFYDEAAGITWADYFLEVALNNARNDHALCAAADKVGFSLPEEIATEIEQTMSNMASSAASLNYPSLDKYLSAIYCHGATEETYREYYTMTKLAEAFYNDHLESLTYDNDALREYEKDKFNNYSSYGYVDCYLSYQSFLPELEEGEEYTDEQRDAAREAAKAAAESLLAATNPEELETLIAELEINKDKEEPVVKSETKTAELYTAIDGSMTEWLSDEARAENDIASLPVYANDEEGNPTETINGYHVVLFQSSTDNSQYMSDVRHLLVQFDGGTTDEATGQKTYSEAEKKAAKEEAEKLLKQWKDGKADEDSFIELVKQNTDDTASAETGGLYENVNPDSNYVPNFLAWSIDPLRQKGDTEIVETEYGYHIMYYVGQSKLTYRDHMLIEEMKAADQEKWHHETVEALTATLKDTSIIKESNFFG